MIRYRRQPGTILFEQVYNPGEATYYYEGWSMEGDGSGKGRVLPPEFFDGIVNEAQGLTPSASVYGSDPLFDRWWLGAKNLGPDANGWTIYELVARRPVDNGDGTLGLIEVQLTNFGDEIRVGLGSGCRPEWSNDVWTASSRSKGSTSSGRRKVNPAYSLPASIG